MGEQSLPLLKSSMWARQARQVTRTESKQWTLCSLAESLSSRFLECLLCSRGVGREECGGGRSDAGVGKGCGEVGLLQGTGVSTPLVLICLHP